MEAGKHIVNITDYGISMTRTGKPQVFVQFESTEVMGGSIRWYGSLDKGLQITLKALITMGLKDADMEALSQGPSSGLLDTDTPVSVTVEMNEFNGKTSPRVKWINKVGGEKFERAALDPQTKAALSGLNANLKAMLVQEGVKAPTKTEVGF